MLIQRVWAMPSKDTFTIKPIQEVLNCYVKTGKNWIDPFAGEYSRAEITNDLNPDKPTQFHLHAKDFVQQLTGEYEGCLFDPPYSPRQMKEVYNSIGIDKISFEDSNQFPNNIKKLITPKIKEGGIVICCGWNSSGFGKELGFELIEILMVCHGGHHNDTIVTVERKLEIFDIFKN